MSDIALIVHPHQNEASLCQVIVFGRVDGAGVAGWGVGLGVARGDFAEEPVIRT
jgi:hypothetical protein